jgi:hypothetical protein
VLYGNSPTFNAGFTSIGNRDTRSVKRTSDKYNSQSGNLFSNGLDAYNSENGTYVGSDASRNREKPFSFNSSPQDHKVADSLHSNDRKNTENSGTHKPRREKNDSTTMFKKATHQISSAENSLSTICSSSLSSFKTNIESEAGNVTKDFGEYRS